MRVVGLQQDLVFRKTGPCYLVPVLFSWRVGSFDFAFLRDLVYICLVFINMSCQEKKPKHTDIAHGHGGVPVPAAVRLQACRPLLPSAAAAGMPQPPNKRKKQRPPQPAGL